MFNRLRLQLTLLYLGVAVLLVLALSASTYGLVSFYFESATDLAMQRKMAQEFRNLGLTIPSELAEAEAISGPAATATAPATIATSKKEDHRDDDESHDGAKPPTTSSSHSNPENDVELAAISPLYIDVNGSAIMSDSLNATSNLTPYTAALTIAQTQGHDHRTITLSTGERQRILTYWLNPSNPSNQAQPAYIQLTRLLVDQDQIRNRLLLGLLILSVVGIVILGGLSWWLANRSIKPAQRAWEQQRQFVANASHELRTPLTLLRANAETLQQNLVDAVQSPTQIDLDDSQTLLQNILTACDHTDRLVGDLLLLSRLDAGQLNFERVPIDAAALLNDLAQQVRPLADGRAVGIEVGTVGGIVRADLTRLRQVLLILIDNALRYTPVQGRITLSAQPQGHLVQISVIDTGSGIPPEHLSHVFERFYQVDPSHSNKANAGLGLSIAKALVEGMHGHIAITSTVGIGTQITIILPAQGS